MYSTSFLTALSEVFNIHVEGTDQHLQYTHLHVHIHIYIYMEIHVHSTLALRNQKEKKGEVTHPTIAQTNKQTYIHVARHTCIPSLENWGGGLIHTHIHVHVHVHIVYSEYNMQYIPL